MITPLLVLLIVPTWRILQRAGFNGAWALLMLVPIVGVLVPWALSFLKWPSDREYRTSTSKGGVIAGIVLLPVAVGVLTLMVKAIVNLGVPVFEPASTNSRIRQSRGVLKDQFGGELVLPGK